MSSLNYVTVNIPSTGIAQVNLGGQKFIGYILVGPSPPDAYSSLSFQTPVDYSDSPPTNWISIGGFGVGLPPGAPPVYQQIPEEYRVIPDQLQLTYTTTGGPITPLSGTVILILQPACSVTVAGC
jgi:hypothetical protein